jgi:hypothetical protein
MDELSISGLDAAEVLHALYHGTRAIGPYAGMNDRPGFSIDDARTILNQNMRQGKAYFDYVAGRPLKVQFDLEAATITTRLYDRDAGPGTAANVIQTLRDFGRDRSKR